MKKFPCIHRYLSEVEGKEVADTYLSETADLPDKNKNGDIRLVVMNIYNHLIGKGLTALANSVNNWYNNVQSNLTTNNEPISWF